MEKNNKILSILKNASISAVIGHLAAIAMLFLISTALAKNEDPASLMQLGALLAFFVGAAACGIVSGRKGEGAVGSALSGAIFLALIVAVSLLLNALGVSESSEAGYGFGFKLGMLAGAFAISFLTGLWISGRKNSSRSLKRKRKKMIGR